MDRFEQHSSLSTSLGLGVYVSQRPDCMPASATRSRCIYRTKEVVLLASSVLWQTYYNTPSVLFIKTLPNLVSHAEDPANGS